MSQDRINMATGYVHDDSQLEESKIVENSAEEEIHEEPTEEKAAE